LPVLLLVFFLLWGNKLRGKKAFYCYLLGLSFAVLGVFVKPSAVIIFAFIGLFFVYKAFHHWREPIGKQIREIRPSVIKGFAVIGGILILILGFWYLQSQLQPFLMSLYRASTDLSNLFVLGRTQEDVHGQWVLSTDLFLVAAPMFIVAFAGSLTKRLPGSSLPLLWAASVFLVFEWGTRSTNPAVYTPFQTVVNDRNTLFIFAPFVVIVGIFFSHWVKKTSSRWLPVLSLLIVVPLAWWQSQNHFSGFPEGIITITVVVAVIGALVIPFILDKKWAKSRTAYLVGLVLVLLVGFLYPTPPNHISAEFWQSRASYRRVIREAAKFFLDHSDYPILALSGGNARELNFLSSFELGYSVYGVEQSGARIQLASDPKAWTSSAYIYLRDEINQIQPVPSDWWKMAEYDPGSGRPVLIYRHLSATDAAAELESARHAVAENQTVASLERLLAAGVNAANAQDSVTAWIRLNRMSPRDYPLSLLSPTLLDAYSTNELPLGENLLTPSLVGDLDTYQVDPQLQNSVSFEIAGSEPTLSIRMRDYPGGRPGIYRQILLEPDSVYIFSLEVRSTVGVDLLRITGGEIPDTHDYSDVYGEWEQPLIVFVTPTWEDSMSVRLDLLTVTKPGFVEIRNPSLFKVEIVQP